MASAAPPRALEISLVVKTLRPATHTVRISPDVSWIEREREERRERG